MKKTVSLLIAFFIAFIWSAAWDCGCAYAEAHRPSQKVVQENENAHCHATEEKTTTKKKGHEKENCCPGCKLEKQAPAQEEIGNAFLKSPSRQLIKPIQEIATTPIVLPSTHAFYLQKWKQTQSVCLFPVPTYLANRSILI